MCNKRGGGDRFMINEEEIIMNELINPELNNWEEISKHQYLPESFIEKYKYKMDWGWISKKQKLSERFIEKYKDRLDWNYRSEEHTSELQSRQYLVCRLLLEKKQFNH